MGNRLNPRHWIRIRPDRTNTTPCFGMSERLIEIILEESGERLDKALANVLPDLSRTQCQRLIKEGRVTIAGRPVKASYRLEGGERLTILLPEIKSTDLLPEAIELDIKYEDRDIILIDKPAGMVVHPGAGHESGTLANAVLAHCPDLIGVGGERRPGIVHRLDKQTSGLIVVAKNDGALRYLQQQFQERKVSKVYLALVEGHFASSKMVIDAPIGRNLRDRKRMAVISTGSSAHSRDAQTKITLKSYYQNFSLLECRPLTGRTHQIRVHLAFAGFPIVGDVVYGRRKQRLPLDRHFLHAAELTFRRPFDGQEHTFTSSLPRELQALLESLS